MNWAQKKIVSYNGPEFGCERGEAMEKQWQCWEKKQQLGCGDKWLCRVMRAAVKQEGCV